MSKYDDLPETVVEWLSLIRYQILAAAEQSRLVSPLSSLAINTTQDAVESALSLVAQEKGAAVGTRADFLQIFDGAIVHGGDVEALKSFRPALNAMNTARVGFKHHGNPPNGTVIKRHFSRADEFIHLLIREVFDVDLDEVSLLAFIKNEQVRSDLTSAQEKWNAGNREEAMEALRLGFDRMVRDYSDRKQWSPGKGLYSTKPSFYPTGRDLKQRGVEKLDEWLQSMDKWIKYVALGIDMRRFAFFDAYTPVVSFAMGGNHFTNHREGIEYTDEVFARCYGFVVDTGLGFARDDFDFDYWAARRATYPTEGSQ